MDTNVILEASQAAMTGALPFPEIVGKLIDTGVEYYHVDYIAMRKTYYGPGGDVVVVPLLIETFPPVAPRFDAEQVREAIFDSQNNGQKFRDFSRRAATAGVQGYFAFLSGKRVTYWGRDGNQHTEWFPGCEPT